MNESTKGSIGRILSDSGFRIKKHLGQNFLTDGNILDKIVKAAGITPETGIIEVGPGFGSLTIPLAAAAKTVLAYEIDAELVPILSETLKKTSNVILLNRDVLKADIDLDVATHLKACSEVVVVANLPYYITTPILMRFLETSKSVSRLVLMMQEEVAMRVSSEPSTKDYNALTVAIRYRASVKQLFKVPRAVFIPQPNVDSAVVMVSVDPKPKCPAIDEPFFFEMVHRCFSQRRKTIINNLRNTYTEKTREEWDAILRETGIDPGCRAETLNVADFVRLSDRLTVLNVRK
ncbi:MAG: 16S rRNA (adenine(1518)-N(6)/adenine(1519)-N(6))-dimethyltransferase RsmA [Bacillota bacterium]|nr:16S rRNA (adenine(1518)-N(6)/adenine(1519)-N(6))-dimethyltransferase RsmA [Bacillota bacterium]